MQAHFFTFFIGNIFSFYIYWTKFILRFLSKKVLTNWPPSAMIKLR